MGVMAKGSVAKAGHDQVRGVFGEAAWAAAIGELTRDEREYVDNVAKLAHYPLIIDGRIFELLCEHECGGSTRSMEPPLRRAAAGQADAMLDGVFSIFSRFVSPVQAFSRAGSIIAASYTGPVSAETHKRPDGNGGEIVLRGLEELTFAGPWLSGWMERALIRFGASEARVSERTWRAGSSASNELVYDLEWA